MRNHLKIMVRVRTIHYCNVCDYKTNRKYDKDKHVTRMHGLNIQHLKGVPGISNIKEQSIQIQNGLGTAYIPIEKYKEVCNATDQWKICYEKLQKEHTLLQEHRREGTTHIPIEKYKEVCNATGQWKICYEKLQKEHTLLQEHRREDGEYFMERIYYLQNLLNNYNINYEKYE